MRQPMVLGDIPKREWNRFLFARDFVVAPPFGDFCQGHQASNRSHLGVPSVRTPCWLMFSQIQRGASLGLGDWFSNLGVSG